MDNIVEGKGAREKGKGKEVMKAEGRGLREKKYTVLSAQ